MMNWTNAEKFCQSKSSHLASVTSSNTSDYISKKLDTRDNWRIWIGGTDQEQEGVWKWTDSSPWNFTNWMRDEPNNFDGRQNCLILQTRTGWGDRQCWFVCSKQQETGDIESSEIIKID